MSSSNWKLASTSVPIKSMSATAVAPAMAGSFDSSSRVTNVALVSVSVPVWRALRSRSRTLCVKDRDDPLTEMIAKTIIRIAQTGIHDPAQL
jgi:hypothetical protein